MRSRATFIDMDEWAQFRTLLRDRLSERGALARLAKASGLNSPVIGRWEKGESRPSPANLERLAPALGVPYEDLLKMSGYLPGEPSDNLDPQLAALVAAIESGWHVMDSAARDVAERGTRAMFATSADNRHGDGSANRHSDRRRNLDRRSGQQGEVGSDERLSDRNHSVKRLVANSLAVLRTLVVPSNRGMVAELAR